MLWTRSLRLKTACSSQGSLMFLRPDLTVQGQPFCAFMQIDGRLVGVHLSRGGNVDDVALGQMTPIQDEAGGTTGVSIHQLLQLVRMQPNRPECITSAMNIARAQPVRTRKRKADGLVEAGEVRSTPVSVPKPCFCKTPRLESRRGQCTDVEAFGWRAAQVKWCCSAQPVRASQRWAARLV